MTEGGLGRGIDSPAQAARLVRDRRLALGLSQQDLATLAGVGRSVVQKLEGESGAVSLPGFLRLLQALSLDLQVLDRPPEAGPAGEQDTMQWADDMVPEAVGDEPGRYRVWTTVGPPSLPFRTVAQVVRRIHARHPSLGVVASGGGQGGQVLSFGCDAQGATAARRLVRRALVDAIRSLGLEDEMEIVDLRVVLGT
ncbi:MAG: helix-turn-helix domain-containing protein [Candidatus Dormibacteraeota bacterium]|nr:helix-turn-helix domain-containing protein [Candidatus Dormibacteraeota bacterium]